MEVYFKLGSGNLHARTPLEHPPSSPPAWLIAGVSIHKATPYTPVPPGADYDHYCHRICKTIKTKRGGISREEFYLFLTTLNTSFVGRIKKSRDSFFLSTDLLFIRCQSHPLKCIILFVALWKILNWISGNKNEIFPLMLKLV